MDRTSLAVALRERAENFWARCDRGPSSDCWEWQRSFNDHGYGRVTFRIAGEHVHVQAHAAAVMISGREIPEGHEIDHLCGVRACVNPAHLDVVTSAENMRRKWRERSGVNVRERHYPTGTVSYRVKWYEFPDGKRVQCSRQFKTREAAAAFAEAVPVAIREHGGVRR